MEKLKMMIFNMLLHRYLPVTYLVKAYTGIKGYKTQIFSVICILVYIGEQMGQIPSPLAQQLYGVFGASGVLAFMQKLQRYQPLIDQAAAVVKEEANKVQPPAK